MKEVETINALRALFPKSPRQKNQPHDCDAELLEIEGKIYGLSLDEFSGEEDFFNDGSDPAALGTDLAVAVVSDLLAAGCSPAFYMHSIVEPAAQAGRFAVELSKGVAETLKACGCFLLGGDLGRSAAWRYTGLALGPCAGERRLDRRAPRQRQDLWLTGSIGLGNLKALGLPAPGFALRLAEANQLLRVATACIDTSGGLMESLTTLSLVNPGLSFQVDSRRLPYHPLAAAHAQETGLPLAGFAFGGAGEYELLFTAEPGSDLAWARRIGRSFPEAEGKVYWDDKPLFKNPPEARAFDDKGAYLKALMDYLRCLNC